jgi:Heparinase II/III-like protein
MKRRDFVRTVGPWAALSLSPMCSAGVRPGVGSPVASAMSFGTLPAATAPRLFVTSRDVVRIASELSGPLDFLATPFFARVKKAVAKDPVATYPATSDIRSLGDTTADIAFAYLVTQDANTYLGPLQRYAAQSAAIVGNIVATDQGNQLLDYGSLLLGLAMTYDYAKGALPTEVVKRIIVTISAAADKLEAYLSAAPLPYLFNHTQVPVGGLVASAIALQSVASTSGVWLATSLRILSTTAKLLSSDGSSREGPAYSGYYLEWFLKSAYMLAQQGHPQILQTSWLAAYPRFRIYQGLPKNSWNAAQTISTTQDGAEHDYDGPDYLFRYIASAHRDGLAQWYANASEAVVPASGTTYARPVANPVASWLNLVWQDATVVPVAPDTLPTLATFDDIGLVSARSDWSGDESLVMFKCGAGGSLFAQTRHLALLQPGDFGHSHANSGHVSFFAHGEWVAPNAGYIQRIGANENTLQIDDQGQYDSKGYFDGYAQAMAQGASGPIQKIVATRSTADHDIIVGDATPAYAPGLGLTRFVRTLVYLKPDVLLVLDRVDTTLPRKLDLHFHFKHTPVRQADGRYVAKGTNCVATFTLLTPGPSVMVTQQAQKFRTTPATTQAAPLLTVSSTATSLVNAVAFSTAAAGATPAPLSLVSWSAAAIVFSAAGWRVSWDPGNGAVAVVRNAVTLDVPTSRRPDLGARYPGPPPTARP